MKPDIRWQILLALTGLSLVLLLLSFQVQSASFCTTRVPASGGTIMEGMVGRPTGLNPLLSDPYPVDRELVNLIFDGLVRFDYTGQILPALAESWEISEDGLTLTFTLREGMLWHDGQPVTAQDVAFTYNLLKNEEFPGPEYLKELWGPVTITVVDDRRIEFALPQPYAPFFSAVTRGIIPAHLLAEVPVAELGQASFSVAPVGTGPFRVEPGQDWERTGRIRLTPNPDYWREGTQLSDLEIRFYPSEEAMLTAFSAGELHSINGFSTTSIPDLAGLNEPRLFTSLSPRYSSVLFNLSQERASPVQVKEVRQALAYALDRSLVVDSILNGQGVEFEGPYLPDSWMYRPDLLTTYTYQPETAAALLDGAGWIRADTGPRQREGMGLSLALVVPPRAEAQAIAEELARQWETMGVGIELIVPSDLETYRQLLAAREFDIALTEVLAADDPDLYDFWSQEAIINGQNFAGWNNRRASEALEAGRQIFPINERAPFYENFIRQYDSDLPALTLFQHVDLYALDNDVQRAEIGRVWEPRDRFKTFASWFLNYRDLTISCPADTPD